jgi:hypothetical protein
MSDNGLETSSTGDSLGYTITAIGRGDDDTSDVVEVGGVVDKSGVGLLVTKKEVSGDHQNGCEESKVKR